MVKSTIEVAGCAIDDIVIAIRSYACLSEEKLAMRALLQSPRNSIHTKGKELLDTVSSSPVLSVGIRIVGGN